MHDQIESLKATADLASVAAIFAVFMNWLPNLAALLTVAWLGVRLYNEIMTAVYRSRQANSGPKSATSRRKVRDCE